MSMASIVTPPLIKQSPPGSPAGSLRYLPRLDALRAFAVTGVIVHHYVPEPMLGILAIAGVKLFFVLSGFLITRLLLVARDDVEFGHPRRLAALARFYARRVLRIFPLYYLVVAVLVAVDLPPAREVLPWLLSYTLNFHMASHGYVKHFAHFWTLAVEEQFYVVWPWVILFAPRSTLLPVVLGFIAVAPAYRAYGAVTDLNGTALFVSPFASLDSLGMGALLALVAKSAYRGTRLTAWCWERLALPAGLVGTGLFYLVAFHSPRWWRVGLVGFDLVLAVLFARLIDTAASRARGGLTGAVLESRPLVYLGKISYGIYVYHAFMPLGVVLLARRIGWSIGPENWVVLGVAAAVATVSVASLSWLLFEHPINRMKRLVAATPVA
jgi:peptidoglycan/LPS O-acetylase OafA/YrhL